MISLLNNSLKKYNYSLPDDQIAQKPASPRDSAKLLVYDRKLKTVNFDTFANLPKYLPKNSILVFNNTKVLPARLTVTKLTGGKAKILYTETKNDLLEFISDRKLDIDSRVYLTPKTYFTVKNQYKNFYYLKPSFPIRDIFRVLKRYGRTPIPPYIKHSPLTETKLRQEYQTIFASKKGSVAAPTASLHFTKRLLIKLKKSGVKTAFVTLHVGLGTFAPLTKETIRNGKLHTEYYSIDKKAASFIYEAKKNGAKIIAVGTTVTRTLESATNSKGKIVNGKSETRLFIKEGYKFKFIDGMITNFHVPKSSLLMLVSALVGRKKILDLYKTAIKNKLRFFSFGDGMLIK